MWRKKRESCFQDCILCKFYFTGQKLNLWFWISEICCDGSLQLSRYNCAPISLHTLNFPVRLTSSLVGCCLSIRQPHRDAVEERVADIVAGCTAFPAQLCQAGRCCLVSCPVWKQQGPGTPVARDSGRRVECGSWELLEPSIASLRRVFLCIKPAQLSS